MALTTVTEPGEKSRSVFDERAQEYGQQVSISVDPKLDERDLLKALGDECARTILLSVIDEPKSAIDISREKKIPISSVYRKLHWLENTRLVKVKGFVITGDGKKYHLYQSRIKAIQISLVKDTIAVKFTNRDGKRYTSQEQEIPIQ
ncbi:MAG: hypothetical protein QXU32_06800 [Nitrososphaerales archaeon]